MNRISLAKACDTHHITEGHLEKNWIGVRRLPARAVTLRGQIAPRLKSAGAGGEISLCIDRGAMPVALG